LVLEVLLLPRAAAAVATAADAAAPQIGEVPCGPPRWGTRTIEPFHPQGAHRRPGGRGGEKGARDKEAGLNPASFGLRVQL
jgi:hypothetical protein